MKIKRITAAVLLSALVIFSFAAGGCSSKKTEASISGSGQTETDPSLFGTWINDDVTERLFLTYTFNSDNTGIRAAKVNPDYADHFINIREVEEESDFTYEFVKGGINLRFPGGGYLNFDYIVSGDTLKLSERYKNEYKTYRRAASD